MEANLNGKKTTDYLDPKTKKFKKGNPGGGRKVGSISVVSKIKARLRKIPKGKKHTYLSFLVKKIFDKAIKDGDEQMIKLICNYVDGMPKQSNDINLEGKLEAVLVKFIRDENDRDTS